MTEFNDNDGGLFDLFKSGERYARGYKTEQLIAAAVIALHEISCSLRSINDHLSAISYALEDDARP